MTDKSANETLQDYFTDMLGTSELALPDDATKAAAPIKKNAPQSPSPRQVKPLRSEKLQPARGLDTQEQKKQQLERLLSSARAKLEIAVEPKVELKVEAKIKAEPQVEIEAPEPVVEIDTADEVDSSIAEELALESDSVIEFLNWCDNGRPQWAQERFEVLLFQVSGLTLAVPLIALGQIQAITDGLTPLFGQADWFMGLQPSPAGEIRTVNTALFVMPERYDPNFVKSANYVMSLNGVSWGLAVDTVNQPITLEVDDVKWRSERTKRPWLAGTVKEHMCALIDIPQMAQMLIDADHSGSR